MLEGGLCYWVNIYYTSVVVVPDYYTLSDNIPIIQRLDQNNSQTHHKDKMQAQKARMYKHQSVWETSTQNIWETLTFG